jgi:hypothetical protein
VVVVWWCGGLEAALILMLMELELELEMENGDRSRLTNE